MASLATITALLCGAGAFFVLHDSRSSAATNGSTRSSALNDKRSTTQSSTVSGEGEEHKIVFANPGGEALDLDVYFPKLDGTPIPALLLVHGGGWRKGGDNSGAKRDDPNEMAPIAAALRDALHVVVFNVNYRLHETPGYPAEVDDIETAVKWVRAEGSRWNVDGSRIALLGASAGGNLVLTEGLRGQGAHDDGTRVAAIVSLSGPSDLAALVRSGETQPQGYLGCPPEQCPDLFAAASPITYVDPSDPPVFLASSYGDSVPPDQALTLARKLLAAGVTTEVALVGGEQHGAGLSRSVQPEVVAFLQRALDLPGAPAPPPPPDLDALQSKAAN